MGRVASSGQRMSSWLLLTILLLLLSTLLASNDSYQSEASELQWTHLQVKFGPRTVLDVGPGSIAGGRLLGILGPSGCGKSTLLNALGSRAAPTSGHVYYQGRARSSGGSGVGGGVGSAEGRGDMGAGSAGGVGCSEGSRQLPSSEVALVHQQDAFFPMLTVGETLVLAAQLRQVAQKGSKETPGGPSSSPPNSSSPPSSMSERVRAVVRALGLQDVLHSYVGNPTGIADAERGGGDKEIDRGGGDKSSGGDADDPRHQTAWRGGRGISGGERKRLAVACAMLGSPSLLIADEPTSGLDSFQALQIARLLHDLARREGIIVLCSMHQPRSSIWALFDDVMLLTPHGRVAYHGPQTAAIGYFASLGHPCPPHTNPAEHLIDLVSLDSSSEGALRRSHQLVRELADQFEQYRGGDVDGVEVEAEAETEVETEVETEGGGKVEAETAVVDGATAYTAAATGAAIEAAELAPTQRGVTATRTEGTEGTEGTEAAAGAAAGAGVAGSPHAVVGSRGKGRGGNKGSGFVDSGVDRAGIRGSGGRGSGRGGTGGQVSRALGLRPRVFAASVVRSFARCGLLLQRAWRQASRDSSTNLVRLATSATLAAVVGAVYGWQGPVLGADNVAPRVNIIAQSAINVAMLSMIKTLQLFERERTVVSRERAEGQYSAAEYLLSKAAVELPLDAFVAVTFGLVLHSLTGLRCGRGDFLGLLGLVGACSSALGLAVSAVCPSGDVALAVGPALMVVYLIIGAIGPAGVSAPQSQSQSQSPGTGSPSRKSLSPTSLRVLSPMKWACEGLLAAEFQGQGFGQQGLGDGGVGSVGRLGGGGVRSRVVRGVLGAVGLCARLGGAAASKTAMLRAALGGVPVGVSVKGQGQGTHRPKGQWGQWGQGGRAEGDVVLSRLGIPQVSYGGSAAGLWALLGGHLLLALAGLVLRRSER